MISIFQAVQSKFAAESFLSLSPSSKNASVKSSTLDFKKLKNDALTDLTTSEQTKVKDEDDQASEQAVETTGLGFVLSCAGQTQYADSAQDAAETDQSAQVQALIDTVTTSGSDPETNELSEGVRALSAGIADILEGLLREGQPADEAMRQAEQLLTSAYEQAVAQQQNASLDTDENSTDAVYDEAGMLEEISSKTMQARLRDLIHEYLCSLENTGNTEQSTATANTQTTGTQTTGTQTTDTQPMDNAMAALQGALRQLNKDAAANSSDDGKQAKMEVMPRSAQSKNAQHFVPFVAAEKSPALTMEMEQTVSSATFVKETDMADNISRIVQSISARFAEDAQEFTISLKPEHLGKLSIKLIMDSDGLRAQIKAADSSVSGLIRSELNTLSDSLKDKGIPVTQIDVSYDTAAFLTDARQGNSGQYPGSSSKNRRTYTLNGTEPYGAIPALTDSQQLLIQGSSIEFQA